MIALLLASGVCLALSMVVLAGRLSVLGRSFIAAAVVINLLLFGFFVLASGLSGDGVNEAVLYHLIVGLTGAGLEQFAAEILLAIGWIVLSVVIAFKFFTEARRSSSNAKRLIGIALLIFATAINPSVIGLSTFFDGTPNPTQPVAYVANPQVSGRPVKNLVYLYIESLERGYLDESVFPGLLPNLTALEQRGLRVVDLEQADAAAWTIAGMVASQCGAPLIVSGEQNSLAGVDQFLPGTVCISDVLKSHDYQLHYMGGADTAFGGKGDFYRSHGFDDVAGAKELLPQTHEPGYQSDWGLFDDSLFQLALAKYRALLALEAPFAFFLLTLDTHQPYGHVNRQCGDLVYGDGSSSMLNAVHCADQVIAEFVNALLAADPDGSTIVVVGSDHLAMPNDATARLEKTERRNLWFALGAGVEAGTIEKTATTFDLAPTTLGLLGASVGAMGFGRNLTGIELPLQKQELDRVISEHRAYFKGLWRYPELAGGLNFASGQKVRLKDDRHLEYPALVLLDKDLTVTDVLFRRYGSETLLNKLRGLATDQRFLWLDRCDFMAWLRASPASSLSASPQWCLSYGAMAADKAVAVTQIQPGITVPASELEAYFGDLQFSRAHLWPRLARLRSSMAEGQIPAH